MLPPYVVGALAALEENPPEPIDQKACKPPKGLKGKTKKSAKKDKETKDASFKRPRGSKRKATDGDDGDDGTSRPADDEPFDLNLIPSDARPQGAMKGKFSYTIVDPGHSSGQKVGPFTRWLILD